MKKVLLISGILIVLAILLLIFGSRYGVKLGEVNFSLNKDKQILEEKVLGFLEDIKFKDFQKAATYHSKDEQDKVNIPALIESKFQIKPELLDITKYEVKEIELDNSGNRAKVKTRTIFKVLNSNEVREMEMIFYFHRHADGNWYMELQSSL